MSGALAAGAALLVALAAAAGWRLGRAATLRRLARALPGEAPPRADALAAAMRARAERVEALERAREAADARLAALVAAVPAGVLVLDGEGRVRRANPAARRLLGLTRAPEGRTLLEAGPLAELDALVRRAGREGRASAELERPRPDGLLARLLASAAPLPGGGTVLLVQDLTDLRRLETVRQDFAAHVSHELRTPIGAIRANAEALVDGALDDPDTARRFSGAILRSAVRLGDLVDDLLRLSRLEAGAWPLRAEAVPLAEALAAVEVPACAEVRLRAEIPGDLAARADRAALERVLRNLLENACRYAGEAGPVTVTARPAGEPPGSRVRVEVRDLGPGVPAAHRRRLFERFYRVDPGRSRAMGGTGLGLAIVRHLVEAMGGRVGMEPNRPRGAVFWFELPRAG